MTQPNEIEHEQYLIKKGRDDLIAKFHKAENQTYYSNTNAGRWTIEDCFILFRDTLIKETEGALNKSVGAKKNIWQMAGTMKKDIINYLGAEVVTVYALKGVVDAYCRAKGAAIASKVASSIGSRIESETLMKWTKENTTQEIYEEAKKRASMPGSNPHYRAKSTRHGIAKKVKRLGIPMKERWSSSYKMGVGYYLMDIATACGMLEWDHTKDHNKKPSIIYAERLVRQLNEYADSLIGDAHSVYPLIDYPLDWVPDETPARRNYSGGYHLPELRRLHPMCRSYNSDSCFGEKAIDLLNTLQKTAWRVDTRILELAEWCIETRKKVGTLLVCEIESPIDNAPPHIAEDKERLAQWRHERSDEWQLYMKLTNNGYRTRQAIAMGKQYKFKTFYLSWSLDWRGRYYTQQSWLTLESTDFERSLIKFHDGCKLNADALYWCKAAIGAAFNGSRKSLNERVKWTEDNQELIKVIAENPESTIKEWESAKDPWQFLQLCFEWNDVVITGKEKFWKVPIAADSTASGFQLLSAMRRDPVGMKYANLLPPDTANSDPMDAYIKVLDTAKTIIAEKLYTQRRLLPYLEFRSVGKASLMLAIYGGTHEGRKQKIREAIQDEGLSIQWQDLNDLTKLLNDAAQQVFPAAYDALAFLRTLATKHLKKTGNDSITWTTPTEDSIHCLKHKKMEQRIHTTFNGDVMIRDFNFKEPDHKKEVSSFVPSFVHSYDAALLKEAFTDWHHPIASIHDCIRVLPRDMDRALDRIRYAFTSIVDGDPLAAVADELEVEPTELKRLPKLEQDLGCVLKSRYMFN